MADNENIRPAPLSALDASDYGRHPGYPALSKQTQLSSTAVQDFAPSPVQEDGSFTHHQAQSSSSDLPEDVSESGKVPEDDSLPAAGPSSSHPSARYPMLPTLSIPQSNNSLQVPPFDRQPNATIDSPTHGLNQSPINITHGGDTAVRRAAARLLLHINQESDSPISSQCGNDVLLLVSGYHTVLEQRDLVVRELAQADMELADSRALVQEMHRRWAQARLIIPDLPESMFFAEMASSATSAESSSSFGRPLTVQPAVTTATQPNLQTTLASQEAVASEHSEDQNGTEDSVALQQLRDQQLREALNNAQIQVLTPKGTLRGAIGDAQRDARLSSLFSNATNGTENFHVGRPPQLGLAPIFQADLSKSPSPTSPLGDSEGRDFPNSPGEDVVASTLSQPNDTPQPEAPANRGRKMSLLTEAFRLETANAGPSDGRAIQQGHGSGEPGGVVLPEVPVRLDVLVSPNEISPFTRLPDDAGVSLTITRDRRPSSSDSNGTLVPGQHAGQVPRPMQPTIQEVSGDEAKDDEDRKDSGMAPGKTLYYEDEARRKTLGNTPINSPPQSPL